MFVVVCVEAGGCGCVGNCAILLVERCQSLQHFEDKCSERVPVDSLSIFLSRISVIKYSGLPHMDVALKVSLTS